MYNVYNYYLCIPSITLYTFFTAVQLVRSKHDAILQCLPVDYEKTLQAVQDHLSDEQICIVLSSSDYSSANKVMLDCLLVKMNCTGNLLEFCDQLEKILPLSTDKGLLTSIIAEFRRSMYIKIML